MHAILAIPDYSSFRSKLNGDLGGRTQMASLVTSALVLLATFYLLPWLYFLPKCVLASMSVPHCRVLEDPR